VNGDQGWWSVHDPWTLVAFVVWCALQAYSIYQQHSMKHQMNSLLDARVLAAQNTGAITERNRAQTAEERLNEIRRSGAK
jgi:hypothetical protein